MGGGCLPSKIRRASCTTANAAQAWVAHFADMVALCLCQALLEIAFHERDQTPLLERSRPAEAPGSSRMSRMVTQRDRMQRGFMFRLDLYDAETRYKQGVAQTPLGHGGVKALGGCTGNPSAWPEAGHGVCQVQCRVALLHAGRDARICTKGGAFSTPAAQRHGLLPLQSRRSEPGRGGPQ